MARESELRSWAKVKSGRLWPACCVCFPACLPDFLIAHLLADFPAACMPACERACLPALPTYLPALPTYGLSLLNHVSSNHTSSPQKKSCEKSSPCSPQKRSHELPSEEKLRSSGRAASHFLDPAAAPLLAS